MELVQDFTPHSSSRRELHDDAGTSLLWTEASNFARRALIALLCVLFLPVVLAMTPMIVLVTLPAWVIAGAIFAMAWFADQLPAAAGAPSTTERPTSRQTAPGPGGHPHATAA